MNQVIVGRASQGVFGLTSGQGLEARERLENEGLAVEIEGIHLGLVRGHSFPQAGPGGKFGLADQAGGQGLIRPLPLPVAWVRIRRDTWSSKSSKKSS